MLKINLFALLFLFLVIGNFSCNSDDTSEPEPESTPKEYFLTKISTNTETIFRCSYTSNNKISSIKEYSANGNVLFAQNIFYTSDKETIERIEFLVGSSTIINILSFEYPYPDTMIIRDSSTTHNAHSSKAVYVFDTSSDCDLKSVTEYNHLGELEYYYEYTYTGDNCDYEYILTGPFTSTTKVRFKHDDQKGARNSIVIPTRLSLSIFEKYNQLNYFNNFNVIECEYEDHNGDISEYHSYNSIYEYNEDGYPIKENRIYDDGTNNFFLYSYEMR